MPETRKSPGIHFYARRPKGGGRRGDELGISPFPRLKPGVNQKKPHIA
jgi:hypothetical protein